MLLSLAAFALPPANTTWTRIADDPVSVECSTVSGATWCRATGHSSRSVAEISRIIEDRGNYPKYYAHVSHSETLPGDLFHVQLDLPAIVGDRDWVVRTSRIDEGTIRYYRWVPAPDSVPLSDGFTRLRGAEGEWRLTPDGTGTALRYTWQAEYEGGLPQWIQQRIRAATGAEMIGNTRTAVGG